MTATAPLSVSDDAASSPRPLSLCLPSRRYRVVAIAGDDAVAERLHASGVWIGALIERLARAPFGDPLLFRVHGFRLALRASEAARVMVVEAA